MSEHFSIHGNWIKPTSVLEVGSSVEKLEVGQFAHLWGQAGIESANHSNNSHSNSQLSSCCAQPNLCDYASTCRKSHTVNCCGKPCTVKPLIKA